MAYCEDECVLRLEELSGRPSGRGCKYESGFFGLEAAEAVSGDLHGEGIKVLRSGLELGS